MNLDLLFIIYLYLQLSSQVLTATLNQGTVPEHVYLYLISFISLFSIHVFPHCTSLFSLLWYKISSLRTSPIKL